MTLWLRNRIHMLGYIRLEDHGRICLAIAKLKCRNHKLERALKIILVSPEHAVSIAREVLEEKI